MILDPLTAEVFFCFDGFSFDFPFVGGRPRGRLDGRASSLLAAGCALMGGRPRGRLEGAASFFEAIFASVAGRPRGRLESEVSFFKAFFALPAGRPRNRFKGARSSSTKDFRVLLSIFGDNEVDFLTLWVELTSGDIWRLLGPPAALLGGGAAAIGGSGGGKSGFIPCPAQISRVFSLCVVTGGDTCGFSQVIAMLSSYLPTSGSICSQKSYIPMPAGLIPQNLRRL